MQLSQVGSSLGQHAGHPGCDDSASGGSFGATGAAIAVPEDSEALTHLEEAPTVQLAPNLSVSSNSRISSCVKKPVLSGSRRLHVDMKELIAASELESEVGTKEDVFYSAPYFGPPRGYFARQTVPPPEPTVLPASCTAKIPTQLHPEVGAARVNMPCFRQWWEWFAVEAAKVGINADLALSLVRHGFIPEFLENPNQRRLPRESACSVEQLKVLDVLIMELRQKLVVEECPEPDFSSSWDPKMQFHGGVRFPVPRTVRPWVNVMFAVPKPGKVGRAILNSKPWNVFIVKRAFKMEGIHTLRSIVQLGDYFCTVDISDCYHAFGINQKFKDQLLFRHRGAYLRFRGAPFGISSLPRICTKFLRVIAGYARAHGLRIVVFLDDWIILHQNPDLCVEHTNFLVNLLVNAGFLIRDVKCILRPVQCGLWLGWSVDCLVGPRLVVPYDKRRRTQRTALELLRAHRDRKVRVLTMRDLLRFKGRAVSVKDGCAVAVLRTRATQRLILLCYQWDSQLGEVNYDATVDWQLVTREVLQEWTWWVKWFPQWNGKLLHVPAPTTVTDSDAAGSIGGGMVFLDGDVNEDVVAQWHWTRTEMFKSINFKELVSFPQGVKSLAKLLPHRFLDKIWLNNTDTCALSYVVKQGGRTEYLSRVSEDLWEWLLLQGTMALSLHKRGVDNGKADAASRWRGNRSEWQLNVNVFKMIDQLWGPHDVDLFASRTNTQLPTFMSRGPSPDAAEFDALQQDWAVWGNLYANPPAVLIPQVLRRVREYKCSITLVAPVWTTQPWIGALMALSIAPPLLLPKEGLFLPTLPTKWAVEQPPWRTAAWRLCGRRSLGEVFSSQQWKQFFGSGAVNK